MVGEKGVVVVWKNEGCVVGRRKEVKGMGMKMGRGVYEMGEMVEGKNVGVLSWK